MGLNAHGIDKETEDQEGKQGLESTWSRAGSQDVIAPQGGDSIVCPLRRVPSPIPSSSTSCGGGLGIRGEWGIEATVSPLLPSGEGGDVSETREDVL